jgi:DNA adenine methylase
LKNDGLDIIKKYSHRKKVFFYIDPPYYNKGALLYLNAFDHQKHLLLAEALNSTTSAKWVLSYDNVQEIRQMYLPYGRKYITYSLRYSVHSDTKFGSELMIFSDAIKIPD